MKEIKLNFYKKFLKNQKEKIEKKLNEIKINPDDLNTINAKKLQKMKLNEIQILEIGELIGAYKILKNIKGV